MRQKMLKNQIVTFAFGISAVLYGGARARQDGATPSTAPATRPAESSPASAPATATAPASRPAPTKSELEARAFLARAAAKRAPAGEPEITDVTLVFEGESDLDQHNEFEGSHTFLKPNHIRTKIKNNSVEAEHGFDGKQFWIRRGERMEPMIGREYDKDRKRIQDSIHQTNNMLQVASLGALAGQLQQMELLPPAKEGGRTGVQGRIRNFPTFVSGVIEEANITLYFDPKTLDLAHVRAEAVDGSGIVENIEFEDVREVRGVRFPFHIEAWTRSKDKLNFQLQMKELSWNTGIKPETFVIKSEK